MHHDSFDHTIGKLDRSLSEMMLLGKGVNALDDADVQTLKHHAEDMVGAGQAILARVQARSRVIIVDEPEAVAVPWFLPAFDPNDVEEHAAQIERELAWARALGRA